jgi:hypothetical protein
MQAFADSLFFGTAGHEDEVVVIKTDGRILEDATPRDIYDIGDPFAFVPVRYGSMAVVRDTLYVGTRTKSLPAESMGADIIATRTGESWVRSNNPGFGIIGNDAVSALASHESYLYAGTINTFDGFEVWRRIPPISESLPFLFEHVYEMFRLGARLRACLIPFDPSCFFDFGPLYAGLDSIQLGLIRSKFDDPELLKQSLDDLSLAKKELETAQLLVGLSKKAESIGEAQRLRSEGMTHMDDALNITHSTLIRVKTNILP